MNKQAYYIYKQASITKLAADPIYTEEDFNRKVDEYKKSKRNGIPEAVSYDDMFNQQLDARQQELDDANNALSKAVRRANGFGTWATGIGGLAGASLGGYIADGIWGGWHKPQRDEYGLDDAGRDAYLAATEKYKKNKWGRILGGLALRGGGFLLGGLLPYLASRGVQGAADGISYGAGAVRNRIGGRS